MSTESQQQIARAAAKEIKDKFDGEYLNIEKLTPIILSAIERQYEVEFGVKPQQEWTPQWLASMWDMKKSIDSNLERLKDAHNAALTAERQRRKQVVNEMRHLANVRLNLEQQLLSAQAAIADALKAWFPAKHNIEAYEHLLNHDLSLLHQHDENLTAEVRKPLVDALESIAANTCCDKCQEAALVAKSALEKVC